MERAAKAVKSTSRRGALAAGGSLFLGGVALAAAYFPMLFNTWLPRDDEGVFEFGLRESLAGHGHLYSTIWSDLYGPFYYGFMTAIYRVIGQQPTLANGRWIVLILTAGSAMFFGGAVWRVTRSIPGSIVAEVASFLIVIQVAGNEPMHPGSLGVFMLAVVAFEMASYAATRKTAHLVGIGLATGALLMIKINVGGLVVVAVVFGLVVGSRRTPRWMQIVIAALACLAPIALMSQNILEAWVDNYVVLVSGSLVAVFVLSWIDPIPLPRWPLVPVAIGAAVAMLVSLAFPLLIGTPLSDEINGVFIRPLTFGDTFIVAGKAPLDWFNFTITAVVLAAAVVSRTIPRAKIRAQATWINATFAALALWTIGLGVTTYAGGYVLGQWLPVIVVLPAIAFVLDSPEPVRLALRLLIVLVVLQVLVAYPVAGSQVGWATVAMAAPAALGLAAAVDSSRYWRRCRPVVRAGATAALVIAMVTAGGLWPTTVWRGYASNKVSFGLPGTDLMRVDPDVAARVRAVTASLREHCDTFYGDPNLNSYYIFSGLPALTGMVANGGTAGLTTEQQQQVIDAVARAERAGKRVCVLRDGSVSPAVVTPLATALKQFDTVVANVENYTISARG